MQHSGGTHRGVCASRLFLFKPAEAEEGWSVEELCRGPMWEKLPLEQALADRLVTMSSEQIDPADRRHHSTDASILDSVRVAR